MSKGKYDVARVRIDNRLIDLGRYGSPQAIARYQELVSQYEKFGHILSSGPLMIGELVVKFLQYADGHYNPEGGEPTNFRYSVKPLTDLFAELSVQEFGPSKLKELRNHMISLKWSLGVINQRINRIKNLFKWGVSEELVPVAIHQALRTVQDLNANTKGVIVLQRAELPTEEDLNKILPFCPEPVAAMLRLQWLTGMRCKEVRSMKLQDIDRSGEVWFYEPKEHKNSHRGMGRVIGLGPRSQKVLAPFINEEKPDAYLFRRSLAIKGDRLNWIRKGDPDDQDFYKDSSYPRAVKRACEKAGVKNFHPYLLRHAAKMRFKRSDGLDSARAALGHSSVQMTEQYGELDRVIIEEVARKHS